MTNMPAPQTTKEMREEFDKYVDEAPLASFKKPNQFRDYIADYWLAKVHQAKLDVVAEVEKALGEAEYEPYTGSERVVFIAKFVEGRNSLRSKLLATLSALKERITVTSASGLSEAFTH